MGEEIEKAKGGAEKPFPGIISHNLCELENERAEGKDRD